VTWSSAQTCTCPARSATHIEDMALIHLNLLDTVCDMGYVQVLYTGVNTSEQTTMKPGSWPRGHRADSSTETTCSNDQEFIRACDRSFLDVFSDDRAQMVYKSDLLVAMAGRSHLRSRNSDLIPASKNWCSAGMSRIRERRAFEPLPTTSARR